MYLFPSSISSLKVRLKLHFVVSCFIVKNDYCIIKILKIRIVFSVFYNEPFMSTERAAHLLLFCHVAVQCLYSSTEWTDQTLTLERTLHIFVFCKLRGYHRLFCHIWKLSSIQLFSICSLTIRCY